MKKPRLIKLGKWVQARCEGIFYNPETMRDLPADIFIISDGGMTAKQARKLAEWLILAAKWVDDENKKK